ncbi:hypothetical protein H3C66_05745 [Patescibacteria group bacterium]|nr:hypothetical protein [Patescibacteria group bacterium]
MTEHTSQYQRATRLTTSRRVKHEEKVALRQTLLFGLAGVILMILSILVIIPGIIRFIGGMSDIPEVAEDSLPPQIPQFSAPVAATSSASLQINGFTTPKAQVYIIMNGAEEKVVEADDSGNFSTELQLEQGENRIAAYAKNGELESELSREFLTIFDNQKPEVEITEPTENQSIQGKANQNFTVKGKTKPGSRVYLNDRLIFTQADGTFSSSHRLENGSNSLSFKVIDLAGNEAEKVVTVSFQE